MHLFKGFNCMPVDNRLYYLLFHTYPRGGQIGSLTQLLRRLARTDPGKALQSFRASRTSFCKDQGRPSKGQLKGGWLPALGAEWPGTAANGRTFSLCPSSGSSRRNSTGTTARKRCKHCALPPLG